MKAHYNATKQEVTVTGGTTTSSKVGAGYSVLWEGYLVHRDLQGRIRCILVGS